MYTCLLQETVDRDVAIAYAMSKAEEYGYEVFVHQIVGDARALEFVATPPRGLDMSIVVQWVRNDTDGDEFLDHHPMAIDITPCDPENEGAWPAIYRKMPDGTLEWIADFASLGDIENLMIGGYTLARNAA